MGIRNDIESWFPNIIGEDLKIFSVSGDFNCVSYSLDIYDGWMWSSSELWPYDKIPRNLGLEGFRKLYNLYGYSESDDSSYEEGFEKIAFYSKGDIPTHACKQFGYMWRSKLGPSVIIEHQLDWLCGDSDWAYGEVSFIMKRLKK
jgi:hypothetical protein